MIAWRLLNAAPCGMLHEIVYQCNAYTTIGTLALADRTARPYVWPRRVLPFSCYGCIPVALSNSEGVGSVRALVRLPDTHLYIQVLGNEITPRLVWSRRFELAFDCHRHAPASQDRSSRTCEIGRSGASYNASSSSKEIWDFDARSIRSEGSECGV